MSSSRWNLIATTKSLPGQQVLVSDVTVAWGMASGLQAANLTPLWPKANGMKKYSIALSRFFNKSLVDLHRFRCILFQLKTESFQKEHPFLTTSFFLPGRLLAWLLAYFRTNMLLVQFKKSEKNWVITFVHKLQTDTKKYSVSICSSLKASTLHHNQSCSEEDSLSTE